jgi:hypothetical protein
MLDGVGGQRQAPAALPLGKRHGTHCKEAKWARGPVWTVAENLAPTWNRSRTFQSVANRSTNYPIPASSLGGILYLQDCD